MSPGCLAFFWLADVNLLGWVVEETRLRSLQAKLLGGVQKSAKVVERMVQSGTMVPCTF